MHALCAFNLRAFPGICCGRYDEPEHLIGVTQPAVSGLAHPQVMIETCRARLRAAILCCVDEVHHLPRGYVIHLHAMSLRQHLGEVLVEGAHGIAEEHLGIGGRGPMRVQLDEKPVLAATHLYLLLQPEREALGRRRVGLREIGVLKAGQHTPFPPGPVQGERSLDEEQLVMVMAKVCRGGHAGGFQPVQRHCGATFGGIADAVHTARLGRAGCGGEGEVRITTKFTQQPDLGGHTAPASVGTGVAQRPIPMHETETGAALGVHAERAVRSEVGDALLELGGQGLLSVIVVMELHFDLRSRGPADLHDEVQVPGVVLLDRIKEAVTWAAS